MFVLVCCAFVVVNALYCILTWNLCVHILSCVMNRLIYMWGICGMISSTFFPVKFVGFVTCPILCISQSRPCGASFGLTLVVSRFVIIVRDILSDFNSFPVHCHAYYLEYEVIHVL